MIDERQIQMIIFILIIAISVLWIMFGLGVKALIDAAELTMIRPKLLFVIWPIILIMLAIFPLNENEE